MSESGPETLQEIADSTTCAICMGQYQDPKMLFCRHTFCKECLEGLVTKRQGAKISCPSCRKETSLSEGSGVSGLEPAFHIKPLLRAKLSLERNCEAEETATCAVHNEKIMFYCNPCEKEICKECLTKNHNGHPCKDLKEVIEQYKQELASELEVAEAMFEKVGVSVTKFEDRGEELLTLQCKLEDQINSMASQLQQALEAKRLSLISELQQQTSNKLTSLNQGKGVVSKLQIELQSSMKDGQRILDDRNDAVIIKKRESYLQSTRDISLKCQEANLDPSEEANMDVASNIESTLHSIETCAEVTACSTSPQKCYATGSGLSAAIAGRPAAITVHIMNSKSQPCMQGSLNKVEFQILSDIGKVCDSGIAKRKKDNQYELSYTLKSKGYYQLSITIRGQPVDGSPFQVAVKSFIASLWIPNRSIAAMKSPNGLAMSPDGSVLVVNETDQCITVLTQNGEVIQKHETSYAFADVAIGDDDSIYAVSMNENTVVKLVPDESSADNLIIKASVTEMLNAPSGIAFNARNKKVYVSSTNDHKIQVFNNDLSSHMTIGSEGARKLQFRSPRGICCDNTGRVIIADSNNDRIQVLTAEGKFVRMFGQPGDKDGHLKWPLGVAVNASRQIFVTEGTNNRVSIFTQSGTFLKCFGGEGIMKKPCGIAVDSKCGTVLVCSYGHDLIQVY